MKRRSKRTLSRIGSIILTALTVFLSVFGATPITSFAASGVIQQGASIPYSRYAPVSISGAWNTHIYTMDGEYVYCLESEKGAIPSGMNIGEGSEVSDMPLLSAILCLGPGGPLYDTMKYWWKTYWGIDLSDEQAYLYTHVCANYVYQSATGGSYAWKGYNADVANAFFGDYLAYASDLAAGNVNAADGYEYENFKCYVIGTSGSLQNMGYRASCTKKPIPQPTQMNVTVSVTKSGQSSAITDDTISVEGAIYGVYKKSNNQKVGEITITLPDPSDKTIGQGREVITITESGQYYVKEITPPNGFETDKEEYPFTVYVAEQSLVADCTEITIPERRRVSVRVKETPETMAFNISVEKIKSAQSYNGTTPPSLAGAVYTLYDQYNNQLGSITLSDATTDPQNPKATGKFIGDLYAGTYYIKETSAPTSGGWTLDTNEYWFKADPSAGTDGMGELTIMGDTGTTTSSGYIKVSNRNLTLSHIEEASGSGSFGFKKARMVNGNYANLEGAVFEMYNYKDVKKNADGSYDLSGATPVATYTSNASGNVVGTDIPTGSYVFHESVVPAGYKACKDFVLTIFNGQISYPASNVDGETRPIILDDSDELGSLTIKKILADDAPAAAKTKTYEFEIVGPNGYSNTVQIKGAGSVTVERLEPGDYTVTEKASSAKIDGYTLVVTPDATQSATINDQLKDATFDFKNSWTPDKGSLKIVKHLDANAPADALTKTYIFNVSGPNNYMKQVEIVGAGDYTLTGLEFGEYFINENEDAAQIAGYTLVVDNHKTQTIQAVQEYVVDITNTYTESGALKITKAFGGANVPAEAATKVFKFHVDGPNNYSKDFEITGANSITITGLEFGNYTVTENEDDAKITGTALVVDNGKTVEVKQNSVPEAIITNTYSYGSLKIKKAFGGATIPAEATTKVFKFTVTGPDNYSKNVEITGNGEYVLNDLRFGQYTVTENETDAQITGYALVVDNGKTANVTSTTQQEVTITNTYNTGSLVIKKAFGGTTVPAEAATKVFKFTVSGPDNYSKQVEITGASSYTLTGLKFGTYTVTENEDEAKITGYALVADNGKTANITSVTPQEVTITNTYNTGSLVVKKAFGGTTVPAAAATKVFKFTVTGPDNYSKQVEVTGAGEYTLTGLKFGTYTVTENETDAQITGYALVVDNGKTATINSVTPQDVVITNTYTSGALTIKKALNQTAPASAARKVFKFHVAGPNNYSKDVEVTGAGQITIPDLEAGTYTVTEDVGDAKITGYALVSTGTASVVIDAGESKEVTITNEYTPTKLILYKTLDGDIQDHTEVDGKIKFEITFPSGTKETYTAGQGDFKWNSNKNRYELIFDPAQDGTYLVEETVTGPTEYQTKVTYKVNSGTEITAQVAQIAVTEGDETVVEFKNDYTGPGSIVLKKTISGAITQAEIDGKLTFTVTAPDKTVETYTVGQGGFDWDATNKEYVKTIYPAQEGTYEIVETVYTPDDKTVKVTYKIDSQSEQTGTKAQVTAQAGKTTTVTYNNDYTEKPGKIKITKQIQGDVNETDLKTMTFEIKNSTGATVKKLTLKDDFTKVGSRYESSEIELPKGTYSVKESVYYVPNHEVAVTYIFNNETTTHQGDEATAVLVTPNNLTTVNFKNEYTEILGSIKIIKMLNATAPAAAFIKTYKFHIEGPDNYKNDVEIVGNGNATIGQLKLGTYVVTEDVDDAMIQNYNLVVSGLNSATILAENDKDAELTITNTYTEVKTGSLVILKEGESVTKYENGQFVWETKPIPGAIFDVYAAEDITDTNGGAIFTKDQKVGNIVTGDDGKGSLTNMPVGKYYALETTAPEGYIINTTKLEFELKEGAAGQEIIDTKTIFDERKKVALNMIKVDKATSAPLTGGEFTVYAKEDVKNYQGAVIASKGTALETKPADANGKINFTLDLPFGSYTVKETKAPDNYNLDSTPIDFTFEKTTTKPLTTITYTFENTEIKAQIQVLKKGESLSDYKNDQFVYEERSLQGAEFDLRKKGDDKVLGHYTTDDKGNISIKELEPGIYTLTETKAPYGMTLDTTPIEVEAKRVPEGQLITVTTLVNNRQKITLDVKKQDKDSKNPLSGGQFDLYAAEDIKNYKGEVIVKKDTLIESVAASNGKVAFKKDIPHAKYYIKESKAIDGYKDNSQVYNIDASYQNATFKVMSVTLLIDNEKKTTPPPTNPPKPPTPPTPPTPPNNYVTGDSGQGGYQVLIGEGAVTKNPPNALPFVLGGTGLAAMFAAIAATLFIKKKKQSK